MIEPDTRLRLARGLGKGETQASESAFTQLKLRGHPEAPPPLNLFRWISARTIKENFNPPTHFSYPFLAPDEEVAQETEVETI